MSEMVIQVEDGARRRAMSLPRAYARRALESLKESLLAAVRTKPFRAGLRLRLLGVTPERTLCFETWVLVRSPEGAFWRCTQATPRVIAARPSAVFRARRRANGAARGTEPARVSECSRYW